WGADAAVAATGDGHRCTTKEERAQYLSRASLHWRRVIATKVPGPTTWARNTEPPTFRVIWWRAGGLSGGGGVNGSLTVFTNPASRTEDAAEGGLVDVGPAEDDAHRLACELVAQAQEACEPSA